MTLDLIHFPNYKKTFFGLSFQCDTLSLLQRIRDESGCRHIIHTFKGRIGDGVKVSADDLTVVLTVPTNWSTRYSVKNYFLVDPVFQEDAPYFRNDASGVVRNLADDAKECPAVMELLQDSEKHGLGNLNIGVSARSQKGVTGCTVFTFDVTDEDHDHFVERMRPRLLSFSGIIHGSLCGGKDANSANGLLTPREVDCLRWAASGKTDGEIAEILSIARWTVVTYLQNAKIKLNCSNRTSAVATALSLGIIDMPEVQHLFGL